MTTETKYLDPQEQWKAKLKLSRERVKVNQQIMKAFYKTKLGGKGKRLFSTSQNIYLAVMTEYHRKDNEYEIVPISEEDIERYVRYWKNDMMRVLKL